MSYSPNMSRYENIEYKQCGKSGLKLPPISLGLWYNFGHVDVFDNARETIYTAFDNGITHFDLANNYGPPPGSAEENFGRILRDDLAGYRDEIIISTKAGWDMWPGPYGDFGSRKYMIASLDQSLTRLGVDYVDVFYHHRPDPETPLEETMRALDHIVRSGKALYVGISNYPSEITAEAVVLLEELGTACLVHQPKYNLLNRQAEKTGLFDILQERGVGCVVFSVLNGGLLTDKYLNGIPAGSRASRPGHWLKKLLDDVTKKKIEKLNEHAADRGQSLAQMAIAWVLRQDGVTTALFGASHPDQIRDNLEALENKTFSETELKKIDMILCEPDS
ncbi:MAG: L-glyceraldehyde 3-phosphate reductase [Candidatus Latescibacterota bacterium]|nr:L-glyceraldehyde 3-phosphate reductase [Candidatus Latescibacterota bacterium]